MCIDEAISWRPVPGYFPAPMHRLAYVLRVYGTDGNFDETRPQPLWIDYDDAALDDEDLIADTAVPEVFPAYGENTLGVHNIGLEPGIDVVDLGSADSSSNLSSSNCVFSFSNDSSWRSICWIFW